MDDLFDRVCAGFPALDALFLLKRHNSPRSLVAGELFLECSGDELFCWSMAIFRMITKINFHNVPQLSPCYTVRHANDAGAAEHHERPECSRYSNHPY